MLMEAFRARLRRVGNSLSVLVPKQTLDELHVGEGDEVEVTVHRVKSDQEAALDAIAGTCPGLGPFKRDRRDRY